MINHPHRLARLNELLQHEVGEALLRFVDLPQDIFVTINRVDTAQDLSAAHIFITVYPSSKQEVADRLIAKQVNAIQHNLISRLRIRHVPQIKLHYLSADEELEKILNDMGTGGLPPTIE